MVNPGSSAHRHQARSKADPTRPHHRMVTLAQSSPGDRSACAPQSKRATVMLRGGTAVFTLPSLHRKFPFLTRMSETGSMTGWGVGSSVPSVSTIQSFQTADLRAGSKEAVSVGIFAGIIPLFRSLVTLAVSQAAFSLPSLHPKIPFPAAGFPRPSAAGNIGSLGRPKAPF